MGRSKLTEENKEEIRKLSKEGWSQAALAAKYDVSTRTIMRLLNPEYYAKELARSKEYQRENITRINQQRSKTRCRYNLSFNINKDAAVIARLDKEKNVSEYIRTLVTDDIKREKKSE